MGQVLEGAVQQAVPQGPLQDHLPRELRAHLGQAARMRTDGNVFRSCKPDFIIRGPHVLTNGPASDPGSPGFEFRPGDGIS
jgi:hypothetical protein